MSILNVLYDADKVLICVDTPVADLRNQSEPVYGMAQKATIHGDVLVASRGGFGLAIQLNTLLLQSARYWRLDDLLPALPSLLQIAQQMQEANIGEAQNVSPEIQKYEVVVAGWSERLQRMEAVVADLGPGGWQTQSIANYMVAPGLDGITRGDLASFVTLKATAKRQIAAANEEDATMPIGGELILYDLVRDGVTVRKLGAI